MALALGRILPRERKRAEVGQNKRVDTCVVQTLQVLGQARDLVVARHRIHRHVDAHTVVVREFHRFGKLLRRKIPRERRASHGRRGNLAAFLGIRREK